MLRICHWSWLWNVNETSAVSQRSKAQVSLPLFAWSLYRACVTGIVEHVRGGSGLRAFCSGYGFVRERWCSNKRGSRASAVQLNWECCEGNYIWAGKSGRVQLEDWPLYASALHNGQKLVLYNVTNAWWGRTLPLNVTCYVSPGCAYTSWCWPHVHVKCTYQNMPCHPQFYYLL